jgi:DNA-binding Lrp family transcriptional regulator
MRVGVKESPYMVKSETLVRILHDHGPLATREVAKKAGCSERAADYRLRKLYADGRVESARVGTTHRWWIPHKEYEQSPRTSA